MNKLKTAETPLMQQHKAIKAKYPDAILLFRVGDFYETFGQDAIIASQVLGITLTKRNNGAAADNEQHNAIKAKYPDAILLFRVGDFYETFGEDAVRTANILSIVLTRRANGSGTFVELAGFPYHSLDSYLPKLVRAGHRVAICDQLEDPKLTKTIVKRGVTELVTPGVAD